MSDIKVATAKLTIEEFYTPEELKYLKAMHQRMVKERSDYIAKMKSDGKVIRLAPIPPFEFYAKSRATDKDNARALGITMLQLVALKEKYDAIDKIGNGALSGVPPFSVWVKGQVASNKDIAPAGRTGIANETNVSTTIPATSGSSVTLTPEVSFCNRKFMGIKCKYLVLGGIVLAVAGYIYYKKHKK